MARVLLYGWAAAVGDLAGVLPNLATWTMPDVSPRLIVAVSGAPVLTDLGAHAMALAGYASYQLFACFPQGDGGAAPATAGFGAVTTADRVLLNAIRAPDVGATG